MRTLYRKFVERAEKLRDLQLLLFRLILVIGFFSPAMMKVKNLSGVAQWFESMSYPFPMVSAFLAMATEVLGIVLLTLGLGTRIIALPLMFVMVVAVFTTHISNGFAAGDNGFEIPLYYFLMLLALVAYGSGKFSLDFLLERKQQAQKHPVQQEAKPEMVTEG
ncbi:MAG: DoxX family protein [Bacteroidales bacterium]|nr:DoxX family protein [Bacteroidales bacterium]